LTLVARLATFRASPVSPSPTVAVGAVPTPTSAATTSPATSVVAFFHGLLAVEPFDPFFGTMQVCCRDNRDLQPVFIFQFRQGGSPRILNRVGQLRM
jgi:hypothetical protein